MKSNNSDNTSGSFGDFDSIKPESQRPTKITIEDGELAPEIAELLNHDLHIDRVEEPKLIWDKPLEIDPYRTRPVYQTSQNPEEKKKNIESADPLLEKPKNKPKPTITRPKREPFDLIEYINGNVVDLDALAHDLVKITATCAALGLFAFPFFRMHYAYFAVEELSEGREEVARQQFMEHMESSGFCLSDNFFDDMARAYGFLESNNPALKAKLDNIFSQANNCIRQDRDAYQAALGSLQDNSMSEWHVYLTRYFHAFFAFNVHDGSWRNINLTPELMTQAQNAAINQIKSNLAVFRELNDYLQSQDVVSQEIKDFTAQTVGDLERGALIFEISIYERRTNMVKGLYNGLSGDALYFVLQNDPEMTPDMNNRELSGKQKDYLRSLFLVVDSYLNGATAATSIDSVSNEELSFILGLYSKGLSANTFPYLPDAANENFMDGNQKRIAGATHNTRVKD